MIEDAVRNGCSDSGWAMTMTLEQTPSLRVRRESIDATITRLRTFIARMERRYECSSEFMTEIVVAGYQRETAEIARWLNDYRTLQSLTGKDDREASTATTTTS